MDLKFLKTEQSKIILGIIWGFGLACIFRSACNGRKCIIYKAPRQIEVMNQIHTYEDKCYTYQPVNKPCSEDYILA